MGDEGAGRRLGASTRLALVLVARACLPSSHTRITPLSTQGVRKGGAGSLLGTADDERTIE